MNKKCITKYQWHKIKFGSTSGCPLPKAITLKVIALGYAFINAT